MGEKNKKIKIKIKVKMDFITITYNVMENLIKPRLRITL